MKKIILALIVITLTIIYTITGAFIYLDIQAMEAPETTIHLDFVEINTEEAIINTMIEVENPNSFEIITQDFEVIITTETGKEVSKTLIDGGDIPAGDKKTFSATTYVRLADENPEILKTKVSGRIGGNFFGFIKKTLPINVNIISSIEDIMQDFTVPVIHVDIDLSDITDTGINIAGSFDVYNQNSFDIYVEDIFVNIENESDEIVGKIESTGGVIPAKSSRTFNGTGYVLIQALNSKTLSTTISALAGVKAAGFEKKLKIETEAQITLPEPEDILSTVKPTELIVKGDYKITARGIVINVLLQIENPNNIAFEARDVICSIYRVDNNQTKLIDSGGLDDGILPAGNITTLLHEDVVLPYSKLFTIEQGRFLPDWLLLQVKGNVTIPGLDFSMWVGISAYQDIRMFR